MISKLMMFSPIFVLAFLVDLFEKYIKLYWENLLPEAAKHDINGTEVSIRII